MIATQATAGIQIPANDPEPTVNDLRERYEIALRVEHALHTLVALTARHREVLGLDDDLSQKLADCDETVAIWSAIARAREGLAVAGVVPEPSMASHATPAYKPVELLHRLHHLFAEIRDEGHRRGIDRISPDDVPSEHAGELWGTISDIIDHDAEQAAKGAIARIGKFPEQHTFALIVAPGVRVEARHDNGEWTKGKIVETTQSGAVIESTDPAYDGRWFATWADMMIEAQQTGNTE